MPLSCEPSEGHCNTLMLSTWKAGLPPSTLHARSALAAKFGRLCPYGLTSQCAYPEQQFTAFLTCMRASVACIFAHILPEDLCILIF